MIGPNEFEMSQEEMDGVEVCPKCGARMREGQALENTASYGAPDFPGSTDLRGQTFSFSGPPRMIKVLKCEGCGHSRRF